jgi:hypothetical protein
MRRRLGGRVIAVVKPPRPRFTAAMLDSMRKRMLSDKNTLNSVTITDDVQDGLRAIVRKTGLVSFHAHYAFNGQRPFLLIGHYPETTIEQARELTKTVRALADMGIDVTEGLHARLIRELKRDGTRWRP